MGERIESGLEVFEVTIADRFMELITSARGAPGGATVVGEVGTSSSHHEDVAGESSSSGDLELTVGSDTVSRRISARGCRGGEVDFSEDGLGAQLNRCESSSAQGLA